MNLSQFRAAISNRLGLDNSLTGDQPSIDGWVNDAINQLLMDTHCYVAGQTITPGATGDYTLPTNVFEIVNIYPTVSGISYGMQRISVPDLIDMRRFSVAASSPTMFYALAGHNLLMFHPAPSATDTFSLYYVPVPTALAASGDDPSAAANGGIPLQFHKAIEYFATAEAADANDDASSQMGQRYLLLYQDQVKRIRRELLRRGGQVGQKAMVGPHGPRQKFARHNNDIYP